MNLLKIIATFTTFAILTGCGSAIERRRDEIALKYLESGNLLSTNYVAADILVAQSKSKLNFDKPILIATIVKTDALDVSSTLGRVTSENIASRFTNAGYKVIEMKFGNSVYMKQNEGELVLTREISSIAKNHDAQGVVVGSYGIGAEMVYMNIKLVQPGPENLVISAHDYVIPKNKEVDDLLKGRSSVY